MSVNRYLRAEMVCTEPGDDIQDRSPSVPDHRSTRTND